MQKSIVYLKRSEFSDNSSILRKPAEFVDSKDPRLGDHLRDLIEVFDRHPIAVGLSAPQIGISFRITVINLSKKKGGKNRLYFNPKIVEFSDDVSIAYESCMSLPFFKGKVSRSNSIKLNFKDENFNEITEEYKGFEARVIQHEVDHLNGVLFIDHLQDLNSLEEADFFNDDDYYKGLRSSVVNG